MKNIHNIFTAPEKKILIEISPESPGFIEDIYEDFKKQFNLQPENILSEKGSVLTLTHPDYDFNINAFLVIMYSGPKAPNQVCFTLEKFSKNSNLRFKYQDLEEIFALDNGTHPLDVSFDQLSLDQDSSYLMKEFLKSLNLENFFNSSDEVLLTHPQSKKQVKLSITQINSADTYGIKIKHI